MSSLVTGDSNLDVKKYSVAMRLVHWLRALIIFGMIWAGLTMVGMDDNVPAKFEFFYPYHKSFGILLLMLAVTQLVLRAYSRVPPPSAVLTPLEVVLSKWLHWTLYVLMIAVPLVGYARSSTYSQSDGVYFFGVNLPELFPKNDHVSAILQTTHRYLAYALLAVVVIHVAAALKHRLLDRGKGDDPISRML
jgi:cytochrome b561